MDSEALSLIWNRKLVSCGVYIVYVFLLKPAWRRPLRNKKVVTRKRKTEEIVLVDDEGPEMPDNDSIGKVCLFEGAYGTPSYPHI